MTSPSSSEQPYVRPRDYWCNVDEEVRIIEAALDLYEQTTMGQPASESEERRLLREVTEGVLEQYAGDGTHRQWGRMTWLYPGTRIVEIDGKTWAAIDALLARPTPSHTAAPISPSGGNGPAPSEKPCATCNDDPAVCATVPGLRHCEKAMRGSALSEYRSSEKPREGAGLRPDYRSSRQGNGTRGHRRRYAR
jgi:hypothetical protein